MYVPQEELSFWQEVQSNMKISVDTQRAVKMKEYVARNVDASFMVNHEIFTEYSYIVIPYCSNGTLLDLIMRANSKGIKLSLDL